MFQILFLSLQQTIEKNLSATGRWNFNTAVKKLKFLVAITKINYRMKQ